MISTTRTFLQIIVTLTLLIGIACGQAPVTPDPSRELGAGDLLPDIVLVNQFGEELRVRDFRGKALAITFIYSRCVSPTLCPLVSRNFDAAQTLLARLGVNEHCHLLSISLDAESDTPDVLAAYAKGCQANAQIWTFAPASESEVRRLGNAVGLEFKRVGGQIDHNLRTVVVDSAGRIRHIFRGNSWTPQELVAELRGARPAR
jgi:protein SCO1/2